MKLKTKAVSAAVLLLLSMGLSACSEKIPPEEAVKQRVQARWDIRVAGKIDGLYDFLSPSKRQTVERAMYERGIGIKLKYTGAEVHSVSCDQQQQICQVKVKVLYQYQGADGGRILEETWANEEGQWWYIPN